MESLTKQGNLLLLAFAACVLLAGKVCCDGYINATCTIQSLGFPDKNISGVIHLQQLNGSTLIWGNLAGFSSSGNHGFHVHEYGNLTNNCTAAGGHYNPFNKTHGAPNDTNRHVGDLGNINVGSDFKALINITDNIIQLQGNYSVINRAIVVHSGEDDLGKGNYTDSLTTGHAGDRVGCCIIFLDTPTTTTAVAPTTRSGAASKQRSFIEAVLSSCIVLYASLRATANLA